MILPAPHPDSETPEEHDERLRRVMDRMLEALHSKTEEFSHEVETLTRLLVEEESTEQTLARKSADKRAD